MFDDLIVRSKISDYKVAFVDDLARKLPGEIGNKTFFLVDWEIARLYRTKFIAWLPKERTIIIKAREENKSIEYCYKVIKSLIGKRIRKDSTIVVIGGGIVQDIAAFSSSILFRGVEWVFVPTTLLAQADSCLGGKTSINLGAYKNLLGNFYPPRKIIIDVGFLKTLPVKEIKSGIGEMFHFFLITGSEYADKLYYNYESLLKSPINFKNYIRKSLIIKKKVIEIDEFDKGSRRLFNYGHTFGHAIETVSQYQVNHGQAVTMGMDIANHVSLRLGYLDERKFNLIHRILIKNLPDFRLGEIQIEEYFKALSGDKKNVGKTLGCVLTFGPGRMVLKQIPLDNKLKETIRSYFEL